MTTGNQRCESNGCIEADLYGSVVRVRSTITGTVMQATREEWMNFIDDVKIGKWDDFVLSMYKGENDEEIH